MWEVEANALAAVLGGEPYHSGGGCWLVVMQKKNSIVVFSEDVVVEIDDPNHEGADVIGLTKELAVINLYDDWSLQ